MNENRRYKPKYENISLAEDGDMVVRDLELEMGEGHGLSTPGNRISLEVVCVVVKHRYATSKDRLKSHEVLPCTPCEASHFLCAYTFAQGAPPLFKEILVTNPSYQIVTPGATLETAIIHVNPPTTASYLSSPLPAGSLSFCFRVFSPPLCLRSSSISAVIVSTILFLGNWSICTHGAFATYFKSHSIFFTMFSRSVLLQ